MEVVNYVQKVFKRLNFCSPIALRNKAFPKSATSPKYSVEAPQCVWWGYGGSPTPQVDSPAPCYLANRIAPIPKESIPCSG